MSASPGQRSAWVAVWVRISSRLAGRIGLPERPGGVVALGAIFIFWGVRAATRPGIKAARAETMIRAGSLALVGILILAVPFVPARHAPQLFILAGGVLVLRGALAAAISVAHR